MTNPFRPGRSSRAGRAGRPGTPPPDSGLQAERTSLAWARTWALLGLVILLVLRLIGTHSAALAMVVAVLLVVPAVGVARVQQRHERRVQRFMKAGLVHQTQWQFQAGLVTIICLVAAIALAFSIWSLA